MRRNDILFPFNQRYTQFHTMPRMSDGICVLYSVWFLWYGLMHNFNSRGAMAQLKEECISEKASTGLGLLASLPEAGLVTKLLADSSVEPDYSGLEALALAGDDDSKALYSVVTPLNECSAAQSLLRCNYLVPHCTDGHQTLQLWSQLNSFDYLALQTWEFKDHIANLMGWSDLTGSDFKLRLLYQKLLTPGALFEISVKKSRSGYRHSIAAFYDPNLNGFVLFDSNCGVMVPFSDIGSGSNWLRNENRQLSGGPFHQFCRYFIEKGYDPVSVTAVVDYRKSLQGNDAGRSIFLKIGDGLPMKSGCQLPEGLTVPVERLCQRVLFERLFKKNKLYTQYNYEGYVLYDAASPDCQLQNTYFF